MVNQNWAFIAIHNSFSGHLFLGLADPADIKIGQMLGYGGRIRQETVVSALMWRRKINNVGFSSVDAFPGEAGEILVSGIQDDLEFEIIVEENHTLTATLSSGDTVLRHMPCGSFADADSVLKEAAVRVWTSSGGLRVTNSIGGKCASPASPFGNHQVMEAFP